jgi:WD domain, G-beta repeat
MAQVQRHRRAIAAGLLALVAFAFVPALAQDKGPNAGTDLYDRPVLVVDPGMHTAKVWSQAVDRDGKYAVTGGADRTVRIWSIGDGKPLRTIWIPIGPEKVGQIIAVAITPDGSTVAAGGWTDSKPNIPISSIASPETLFSEFTAICPTLPFLSRSRPTAATSRPGLGGQEAYVSSIVRTAGARHSVTTATGTAPLGLPSLPTVTLLRRPRTRASTSTPTTRKVTAQISAKLVRQCRRSAVAIR